MNVRTSLAVLVVGSISSAAIIVGCGSAPAVLASDMRETLPYYACQAIAAARMVGAPDGATANPKAPLPDQVQIQFQVATTKTTSAQGQVGTPATFPVALQGQLQYQNAFQDTHQVTVQYGTDASIGALAEQCAAVLDAGPPKLYRLTQTQEGFTAEKLQ